MTNDWQMTVIIRSEPDQEVKHCEVQISGKNRIKRAAVQGKVLNVTPLKKSVDVPADTRVAAQVNS